VFASKHRLRLTLVDNKDKLDEIFERQHTLQREKFKDPQRMSRPEALEYIRWNVLALTDELHEALQEVGWKPWANSVHINRNEYVGELIDATHFLVNLFLVVGATPLEVYGAYLEKNERNHTRQDKGYDGVSEKCPHCKRELD
jgi:dimeric dUTPase (all-alpha-NTP-PPase superfamily)